MPLPSGTRLGAYEITHVLGAGGMGEVYRARDSKLGRSVAIKVILQPFASDGERVSRFEREAKVLASLNHQHIASLYGMEEADGQHFLIMELVEGETLAERLQRGPMPIEEAVRVALQIADALEMAHEKGIVHRDLKPANVKITPDDRVKVLDFGLAKAMEVEASGANVANSPTLSMMATNAGMILGTAAYMSPEQAKGSPADHRSDVFSFGVVFYEMLTGRQPFQGETAPDILASVLVREPELQQLPPDLNPRVAELLRRCLEKSPKRRYHAIGDVRAELESIAAMPRAVPATAAVTSPTPMWRRAAPMAAAALVTGALAGGAAWMLKPDQPRATTRFAVNVPDGQFTGVTRQVIDISPDGRNIVFVLNAQLYLRPMDAFTSKPIAGTESHVSVFNPTISPDGESVAFYAMSDRTIKKVAMAGGAAVTISPAVENMYGMTWGDGGILFGQPEGIFRVSANGGKPELLVPAPSDERVQRVQMLPGGKAILFTLSVAAASASGDRWGTARVVAQTIGSAERKTLVEGATDGWYLPTGHLAYVVSGTVHAAPFDPERLEVKGGAAPIIEGVRRAPLGSSGIAWFAVSRTGSLVYVPGPATLVGAQLDVGLVDRKGVVSPLKLPSAPYEYPRISPDGRLLAVGVDDGREPTVLIYDIVRGGALQRVTFGGKNRLPIWSADGKRVIFQSDREGDVGLYWQAADGTSGAQRLTRAGSGEAHVADDAHPSGEFLLYTVVKGAEYSLWMHSFKDGKSTPFAGVRSGAPIDADFSPDGRWVAYTAGDQTQVSVYVQPFPPTGAMYQLVRNGVELPHHPVWTPDGTELIANTTPANLDAVSVSRQPAFAFGGRVRLAKLFATGPPSVRRQYDMAPDGRIVGLITPGATQGAIASVQMHVVLNWFDELRSRIPTR